MTPTRLHPLTCESAVAGPYLRPGRFNTWRTVGAISMALACSRDAFAQGVTEGGPPEQTPQSAASLSDPPFFQREVFEYVTQNRRDPLLPPGASMTSNPMIGGVKLMGIVHHHHIDSSVVLLEVGVLRDENGQAVPAGANASTGVRLRAGDSVGGTRIAEIHADYVVVEIASNNGVDRRIMDMPAAVGRLGS